MKMTRFHAAAATLAISVACSLAALPASAATPSPSNAVASTTFTPGIQGPEGTPVQPHAGASTAAGYSTTEMCGDNAGTYNSYCMNAWFGGPPVYVWHGARTTNEYYNWSVAHDWCNNGLSTSTCPINGNPSGKYVARIVDLDTGLCVGDAGNNPSSAYAGEIGCSGYGTIYLVLGSTADCYNGSLAFYNNHWSNGWSSPRGFWWPLSYGSQAILDAAQPDCLYTDLNPSR